MELWQMGIISFFAWPSSEVSHHVCLCSVFLVAKKANCIARALTAEAVVELLLAIDGKAGGFLVMKRAAGHEVAARSLQGNPRVDQVDDVRAGKNILDELFRDFSDHVSPNDRPCERCAMAGGNRRLPDRGSPGHPDGRRTTRMDALTGRGGGHPGGPDARLPRGARP